MRFVYKTSYDQDIRLAKTGVDVFWYALLALLLVAAPWLLGVYWLDQLSFVLIYSIIGLGLMLLTGYAGLFSIGHAAFLGIGAYTQALLVINGVPFLAALAASFLLTAALGVLLALPTLRMKGLYLAIATLAFGFIVEEILTRWESLTGGSAGFPVPAISMAGMDFSGVEMFYGLSLVICVLVTLAVLNLLRSPTGRAFIAIRDSEISAQSMGISLAWYKSLAFALSAGITGIGGALYAQKIQYLSPEQFGLIQSIDLVLLIVIGGLGSIHGVFFGAIFVIMLPSIISLFTDLLPASAANAAGIQPVIYGLILILFVIFEPLGIYGRWRKIRTYFELFPMYRAGMFKKQKSYQKTERLK